MAKVQTRDYFTAVFLVGEGRFQYRLKSEQDVRRRVARYLEQYPGMPGYLSRQTWELDDQDGPTEMVSEVYLESINGGEFPVEERSSTALSVRPRFARAEW